MIAAKSFSIDSRQHRYLFKPPEPSLRCRPSLAPSQGADGLEPRAGTLLVSAGVHPPPSPALPFPGTSQGPLPLASVLFQERTEGATSPGRTLLISYQTPLNFSMSPPQGVLQI